MLLENDWAANSRVGMRILAWILSGGKKGFGELSAYFVALAFSRIPIEKLDAPKLHFRKNVDLITGFRGNVLLYLYDAWGQEISGCGRIL